MRIIKRVVSLFPIYFLLIHQTIPVFTQIESDSDQDVCVEDSSKTVLSSPPLPTFPDQAQFTMENVNSMGTSLSRNSLTVGRVDHIYDYKNNAMIKSEFYGGTVQLSYYDYATLTKKTYLNNQSCIVEDIPTNIDYDVESAVQSTGGRWHIRPLNEILLFPSLGSTETTNIPKYIGQSIIRGIPVDQWQLCAVDKNNTWTSVRTWSFAIKKSVTSSNENNQTSVPIHILLRYTFTRPNSTISDIYKATIHVTGFKPGITTISSTLMKPKGVFCSRGPHDPSLVSLNDTSIFWPHRFSVRIDASTSRSDAWESFKFYSDRSNDHTILRYDYFLKRADILATLILDVTNNLTYTMNQQTGTCHFHRGIKFDDVNPIYRPVDFFVKNEPSFIRNPLVRSWSFDGIRACRGEEVNCVFLRTSIEHFPLFFVDDMETPTDEYWSKTDIEYAWSKRSPLTYTSSSETPRFDYPVSLFMRLYRSNSTGSDSSNDLKTEEIEYQFYEMTYNIHPNDFDLSSCYRAMDLSYLHLAFILLPIDNRLLISVHFDQSILESVIRRTIREQSQITSSRINNVQVELIQSRNSIYVFFTLLSPPPQSDKEEISIETAQQNLQDSIDSRKFRMNITLLDEDQSLLILWAIPNSLKISKEFMSLHSNWIFENVSTCNTSSTNFTNTNFTTCNSSSVNTSTIYHQKIINEKYTTTSEVTGVFAGLVVGIVVGLISILLIRFIRQRNSSKLTLTNGNSIINPNSDRSRLSSAIPMTNFNPSVDSQSEL